MSDDVTVREMKDELVRIAGEIGRKPHFCQYLNGQGYIKQADDVLFAWDSVLQLNDKMAARRLQAAKKRFIQAALECSRVHDSIDYATCPQVSCDSDCCREYRSALDALRPLLDT